MGLDLVDLLERDGGTFIQLNNVIRRSQGGVDDAVPQPAGRRVRDAEVERVDPGVAGDVEVAVGLAAGLRAVQGKGEGAAGGTEVGLVRQSAVPDDVGAVIAGSSGRRS